MTDGRVLSEEEINDVERLFLTPTTPGENKALREAEPYVRKIGMYLITTIRDLQRQVSELTEERDGYKRRAERYGGAWNDAEKECVDYKAVLELMSRNDHYISRPYMELATQTLAKHAPRQEDEK